MFFSKKLLKHKKLNHCYFNRTGGKSKGIYKSLNCGKGSKDNQKNIEKNLKIVCKKLRIDRKNLILLNQIHSSKFHFIEKPRYMKKKLIGDALITDKKKIALGVLTADCVPILIYDKKEKIISAIHAGWKGAYNGIIKNVVKFLLKNGCESKNLIAAIGPCISQRSYEVKNDFRSRFLKQSNKKK